MPYLDVCSDGTEVRMGGPGEPHQCQFGHEPPIPTPDAGLWLSAEWVPSLNDHIAVAQAHQGGRLTVSRRDRTATITHPGPCGTQCILVLSDGRVISSGCEPGIGVDGWGYFDYRLNQPIPMQQMIHHPPVYGGVPFIRGYRHLNWIIGQHPTHNIYVAHDDAQSGVVWVVGPSFGSPVQPKIRQQTDGSAIAALTAGPGGQFVPSVAFTKLADYVPEVVAPPRPVPASPTFTRPVWWGADAATKVVRGNCTWSPTDHRPYFEGARWLPPAGSPYGPLKALLFMAKEWTAEGWVDDAFNETVEATRRLRVPVIVYWDARSWFEEYRGRTAEDWRFDFEAMGIETYPGVRCYPGDEVKLLSEPFFLITPLYPGDWGQEATENAQQRADDIIGTDPDCIGKLAFGRTRPGGWWPQLEAYWQDTEGPSKGPALLAQPVVDIEPEPEPEPEPAPAPAPRPSIWDKIAAWFRRWFQ